MKIKENVYSEMYDLAGLESVRKNKQRKFFIKILLCTIIGILFLFTVIFIIARYIDANKPVPQVNSDITASGNAFVAKSAESVYAILDIVEDKEVYVHITDSDTEGNYLVNNVYIVYKDGTYYETIQENINGNYHEQRNYGNIDLQLLSTYIEQNGEKLKTFDEIDIINDNDIFVEANECMVLANGIYRLIFKEDKEYNEIFSTYIKSQKEVIQEYKVKEG